MSLSKIVKAQTSVGPNTFQVEVGRAAMAC